MWVKGFVWCLLCIRFNKVDTAKYMLWTLFVKCNLLHYDSYNLDISGF